MKKLFIPTIISLTLAILGTIFLNKTVENQWKLELNYEHVVETFNVDFKILDLDLRLGSSKMFKDFANKVDSQISLRGRNNPCQEVRGVKTSPNILLTINSIQEMKIEILNKNKPAILNCERYIDKMVSEFELYTKTLVKKKLAIMRSKEKLFIPQEKILKEVPPEIREAQQRLKITLDDILKGNENFAYNIETVRQIIDTIFTIDRMTAREASRPQEKKRILTSDVDKMDIIKKIQRNLSLNKESNTLVGISIFIILQGIFIVILILKSNSSKKILKKKIKKIFT